MPGLAFIVFEEKRREGIHGLAASSGILRTYVGSLLLHLFKRRKFRDGVLEFHLDMRTDIRILLIRLPFPASRLLSHNSRYIERYILKLCTKMNCCRCYVPAVFRNRDCFCRFTEDKSNYSVVFKSLLIPMLDEIYLKNGLKLRNLDTVLVSGEKTTELKTMVRQLEPFVRYLNIVSSDKEAVEAELADICAESGMSVIVGNDLKSMLRNADLIINTGEMSTISKVRIRHEAVVINFSKLQDTVVHGEFTYISGVDFVFPAGSYKTFGEEITKNYSKQELAQILLEADAGILNGGIYDDATAEKIRDIFKSSGCKITGFHGRRGILKVENVQKALHIY